MTTFAIDVACAANTTPKDNSQPVALAYGWAVNQEGGWVGKGQRPSNRAEQMRIGDSLIFTFMDTSGTLTQITNVTVQFAPGETAQPGQADSPFGTSSRTNIGTLNFGSGARSTGCNVDGNGASTNPYQIDMPGDFEMTISFRGGGKQWSVDPEMEVIAG